MKKRINYKNNYIKKEMVLFFVFFVFSFFIVSGLILCNRNYLLLEKVSKQNIHKINLFFKKKLYSNNIISDNVINTKINFLIEENNILKRLNGLKEKNINYEIAEVSKTIYTSFFNVFEISKGIETNIKKGNPVINSEGLVGFISKTSNKISEVELITNINKENMLSVFIDSEDGNILGLLNSYNKKDELFKITNISSKKNVKNGDFVFLSGYNNELYKGIYLGKVAKIEESTYGLEKNIYVKSDVNFDDILYVIVMKE